MTTLMEFYSDWVSRHFLVEAVQTSFQAMKSVLKGSNCMQFLLRPEHGWILPCLRMFINRDTLTIIWFRYETISLTGCLIRLHTAPFFGKCDDVCTQLSFGVYLYHRFSINPSSELLPVKTLAFCCAVSNGNWSTGACTWAPRVDCDSPTGSCRVFTSWLGPKAADRSRWPRGTSTWRTSTLGRWPPACGFPRTKRWQCPATFWTAPRCSSDGRWYSFPASVLSFVTTSRRPCLALSPSCCRLWRSTTSPGSISCRRSRTWLRATRRPSWRSEREPRRTRSRSWPTFSRVKKKTGPRELIARNRDALVRTDVWSGEWSRWPVLLNSREVGVIFGFSCSCTWRICGVTREAFHHRPHSHATSYTGDLHYGSYRVMRVCIIRTASR